MDESTYLAESARFDVRNYFQDNVSPEEFDQMLRMVVAAGDWADRIKKALFYGKAIEEAAVEGEPTELVHNPALDDFVHGVIGIITEASELGSHLLNVLTGVSSLDPVNVLEEMGDLAWYQAVLHRRFGTTPAQAYAANIAKLSKRYPTGFTAQAAEHRNLPAERRVLETHVGGRVVGKHPALGMPFQTGRS